MPINADTLLDRLYLKSQITRWRLLAVVFAVLAGIVMAERYSVHSPIEREFVARLSLEGIIFDDQDVYDLIDDIADNSKARAVIVWIDSPGGSAVGGEEIFLRLRELAKKKPVVAVMRSVAASAGYMVSLGSDYIFAREGTITGSIGVIVETVEITEMANKLGIQPIIVKTDPLKAAPSPLEKSTPEAEQMLRGLIDDFYNRFVDMVAERRQLPRQMVVQLADGRVYSGRDAVATRLVDAIGGEQEAMKYLIEQRKISKGLEIKEIKQDKAESLFADLTKTIGGKFFKSSSIMLDGLVAIWHPQLH